MHSSLRRVALAATLLLGVGIASSGCYGSYGYSSGPGYYGGGPVAYGGYYRGYYGRPRYVGGGPYYYGHHHHHGHHH